MKPKFALSVVSLVSLSLSACSSSGAEERASQSEKPEFQVVGPDLSKIRDDFNAMQDKIRLVFIVGPSCGVCLRGMDDLNEAIVREIQNDSRLHTLVIHVPTLGAEERHVAAAIPLLDGPRVTHYWDPEGSTGHEFQEVLDIPMYAWDVWFIYEPGTRWPEGEPAPMPDYWEHQLPGLAEERKLDGDRFAEQVSGRLEDLRREETADVGGLGRGGTRD